MLRREELPERCELSNAFEGLSFVNPAIYLGLYLERELAIVLEFASWEEEVLFPA